MKKRITWVLIAVLVAGAGTGAWFYFSSRQAAPFRFETAKMERGPITAKVTATGTLSALVTVQVGSQVSGRIESIRVDFGTPVRKGQIVATIDARLFKAAVDQARANLASAEANLERARVQAADARRQAERSRELVANRLIAQADLDTSEANAQAAQAQVRVAEASVSQTRAALSQADLNLDYTTIISPIDGVVVSRSIDVGQTVAASFQAPTLFTIAQDLSKMQVDTSVSEADVGRVRAGMPVTFGVDAYPGRLFSGTVRQVRDAAQTVQNVVTYDAVIDVANPDLLLKPGMTANVVFVYADRPNALRIPNAALRFRPDPDTLRLISKWRTGGSFATEVKAAPAVKSGERLVWILEDGKPKAQSVRIGVTDGTWTELLEGKIREGDPLVTEIVVDLSAMPQKKLF